MGKSPARADAHPLAHAVVPILLLAVVWGCNWPVLKIGVTEIAPLTFRAITLPFAALGMFLVTRWSGESIRIPRAWWGRLATLAFLNIAGWNGFVLFGVQQLPAGRSAIIAYTMPIWSTLIAMAVLDEKLDRRKAVGLALGMARHGDPARRRHPPHRLGADRRADDPGRGGRCGHSARCCCASGSRRSRRTRCPAG